MEPRTSSPQARLRAVSELSDAGVPAKVMVAPVIPGLNDSEIPAILQAAQEHGAVAASYTLLRLPLTVKPVFLEWLQRSQPSKKDRVESRIRSTRAGGLNNSEFGTRMKGTGEIADQIQQTFQLFARRYGLDQKQPALDCSNFERPKPTTGQLRLF
jgi:DNA repair photolyase